MIAFSFNDPAGNFNYTWKGFTLDNWRNPFGVPGMGEAMVTSLQIAAIVDHRRDGPRDADGDGARALRASAAASDDELADLPADVDAGDRAGASLLTLFLNLAGVDLGFWTIVIAHIMF